MLIHVIRSVGLYQFSFIYRDALKLQVKSANQSTDSKISLRYEINLRIFSCHAITSSKDICYGLKEIVQN